MLDSNFKGFVQVVAASILFGLIGIFVKLIGAMPLGSIIFYRLMFGLAVIVLYISCCGRFNEIKLREKKKYILLFGFFQAVTMFSYFVAVRYTTVSIAALLLYTSPVYVTMLSPVILKEKITRLGLFALSLSIAGVIIVIQPYGGPGSVSITGLLMGLVSGVFYALMTISSRYLRNYYSGTAQETWAIIVTMFVFLPYAGAVSPGVLMDNLHLLVLFGIIPTAMAGILYFNGLKALRAQNASIIALLEPASAVVFAFMILGEPVSMTTLLGGGLILLGALLAGREKSGGTPGK